MNAHDVLANCVFGSALKGIGNKVPTNSAGQPQIPERSNSKQDKPVTSGIDCHAVMRHAFPKFNRQTAVRNRFLP